MASGYQSNQQPSHQPLHEDRHKLPSLWWLWSKGVDAQWLTSCWLVCVSGAIREFRSGRVPNDVRMFNLLKWTNNNTLFLLFSEQYCLAPHDTFFHLENISPSYCSRDCVVGLKSKYTKMLVTNCSVINISTYIYIYIHPWVEVDVMELLRYHVPKNRDKKYIANRAKQLA